MKGKALLSDDKIFNNFATGPKGVSGEKQALSLSSFIASLQSNTVKPMS